MSPPRPSAPLPLVLLALMGLMSLLAVAGFLYRQYLARHRKPTSSEVRSNLKALYTGARAYLAERDVYTDDMKGLGFMPDPGNRYTYFSSAGGRTLDPVERTRPPGRPYHAVPGDPDAPGYRRGFATFAQTGCPLTPAVLADGTRAGLGVTPSRGPDPSQAVFIAAAAADLDGDSTVDCWSIATVPREAADGTRILEGAPYNEVNDVLQ